MTDLKLLQLVDRIHGKSAEGKVNWEPTAEENSFQAVIGDYIIKISFETGDREPDYMLTILDKEGQPLESFWDGELLRMASENSYNFASEKNAFGTMEQIHRLAKRRANKVGQAIDNLLDELE